MNESRKPRPACIRSVRELAGVDEQDLLRQSLETVSYLCSSDLDKKDMMPFLQELAVNLTWLLHREAAVAAAGEDAVQQGYERQIHTLEVLIDKCRKKAKDSWRSKELMDKYLRFAASLENDKKEMEEQYQNYLEESQFRTKKMTAVEDIIRQNRDLAEKIESVSKNEQNLI